MRYAASMNCLYLGYETAQWYWEHAVSGAQTLRTQLRVGALDGCVSTPTEVREIVRGTMFQDMPLHVLTSGRFSRNDRGVLFHEHTGVFPKDAFVRLTPSIFVASPQLTFLQVARGAAFGQAFLLGSVMCGSYALCEARESGTVERPRLVEARQLLNFARANGALPGSRGAQQVAKYLIDGSASPRETAALATLALPMRHGGKGLSGALLNYRIDIPKRYAWPGKRNYFKADLCWPQEKVIVEYDSDAEHLRKQSIYRDAEKRNTLIDMGYTPICLTSMQLDSPSDLAAAAEVIRRALGRRRQPRPDGYDRRVIELRKGLGLPWFEGQKTY